MLWTYMWSDGTEATKQHLVSVIAKAQESVLSTELVRTFIDNFYDEQKKYLIGYGFIPYLVYLVATLGYLTSTRESLKQRFYELRFMDYVAIVMMILGTVYFTRNEIVQMKTLRRQYVRVSNLADITYLSINVYFIVDLFTGVMPEE